MGALTGNRPFESEIRFFIGDADLFQQRVKELGGKVIREYSFVDYYYRPKKGEWNNAAQTLRIRQWRYPDLATAVHFTKHELKTVDGLAFKRSVYEQGKIELLRANLKMCQQVLTDLGFKETFSIDKKQGWVFALPDHNLEFCLEDTDILGWTGEIELEGTDLAKIKQQIALLQNLFNFSDEQLSYKPVAVLIEEKLKIDA